MVIQRSATSLINLCSGYITSQKPKVLLPGPRQKAWQNPMRHRSIRSITTMVMEKLLMM